MYFLKKNLLYTLPNILLKKKIGTFLYFSSFETLQFWTGGYLEATT